MTTHRLINLALTAAVVLLIALPLSMAHLLDKQPDRRAETAQSTTLADAQRTAQRLALKERAASHDCTQSHGPQSAARWVDDVQYVCTDRHGRVAVTVAGGLR